jgi:predicted flap endonuclease-1-like 5' DNA nuclease
MSDTNGCKKTCWMIGAAAGLVVAAWLLLVAHLGFLGAVFLGLMTFGLFGGFLSWAFCGPDMAQGTGQVDKPAANDTVSSAPVSSEAVAPEAPAVAVPAAVPASATPAAAAPAAAVMSSAPVAEPKAEAPKPAAPKADAKKAAAAKAKAAPVKAKEAVPAVAPATKAAPKPKAAKAVAAPAEKTAPVKAAAKPAASKAAVAKAAAPKVAAKPAAKPAAAKAEAAPVAADTAAGKKPKGLKAARRGKPDDLKLIEGIGAKLEERLNEWGVFHFDQIAAWGDQEVAYADNNVPRFKGRASRDKWVAQAKLIVSEGVEAFLERAKTNDY